MVGVTGGSLGVGPQLSYRINDLIGIRADATFLGVGHDVTINDLSFRGKLKLKSFGGSLDLYPFGGGFRLSAGARSDRNRVRLTSMPGTTVTVGNQQFTPDQVGTLSGTVKARDFVPTLTVGYQAGLTRGLKFGIDAGVMFQGNPQIRDLGSTGSLAQNANFRAQLAIEQQKIDDKIYKYRFYPVVQASIGYAF
jgi:hypothetical protein